jgi:haloacetate dehalogenase
LLEVLMPDLADLFPGFASHWIDTDAGKIFARSGGSGPPLLLLHGFPQSHVMWHRLALRLAEKFTVIAMDLRGYGWSSVPRSETGTLYSKRAMGRDVIAVMERLGHIHFRLVGHDRGARVAYRLALDHPGCIEKLALLDIEPTIEVWRQIEAQNHLAVHWPWLARPQPEPENEIASHADEYFEGLMAKWSKAKSLATFDRRALAHYRAAWNDPLHIHAFCEDYRAGASIDRDADEDSLATKTRIGCPVSVLWGSGFLPRAGDESVLDVWRRTFAPRAEGQMIEAGHFIAEENPAATAAALLTFL